MLTRYSKRVIVQAVVDEHHSLRVAFVLPIHVAALRLDVIRCNLPPKEAAAQLPLSASFDLGADTIGLRLCKTYPRQSQLVLTGPQSDNPQPWTCIGRGKQYG